jgi:sugar lactone lactonase YvrE
MKTARSFVFLLLSALMIFSWSPLQAQSASFSVSLQVASQTTCFTMTLPQAGCVSIIASVKGKKLTERLWGPLWMEKGTFSLNFPTSKLTGKSGTVDWFSIDLEPLLSVGRQGSGERQFNHPSGIGWDAAMKEIYVADTGNDRIVRLSADGNYMAQYGGFGIAFGDRDEEREDSLDEPWDVAPGGFSNLYVSDQNNDRISEFDAYRSFKGTFFPKKDDKRSRLSRPRGLIMDGENNLWVVEGRGDRVLKFSPGGFKLFEIGGFGWSKWQLKDPTQVSVDSDGRIFICDRGNKRIQVFDRLGSHQNEIRDHLKSPIGVAVDPDGLLAICDESTSELGLYLQQGQRLAFWHEFKPGDPFRTPSDVIVTADRLILADSGNHRILIFKRVRTAESRAWQGPKPAK